MFDYEDKGIGKGYRAYVKKKGKKVYITPTTTRESALDIGAKKAAETLSATFGVEKAGGRIVELKTTGEFKRYQSLFREYRIQGKTRLALPKDTFIQKAPTRLGRRTEVSEIQSARRAKQLMGVM